MRRAADPGAALRRLAGGRAAALAGEGEDPPAVTSDRVEELQQDLDSLTEDVEDLQEPVDEFELFDECMYLIGVTEYGSADGPLGYVFGQAAKPAARPRARHPRLQPPGVPVPGVPGRGAAEHPVVAMLLLAPPAALGGGDEDHAPPSAGPPGPWDGPFGKKVPYRPSGTHRCGVRRAQGAGPGSVLGLFVERARCRDATRLVRAYQSCLERERGRVGGCYDRIDRRCVQPEFLGRCRTYDRFYLRRRFRCIERRRSGSEAPTTPTSPAQGPAPDRPQLHAVHEHGESRSGREPELRAAWANPRISAIRSRATSCCAPAASATRSASRRADHRSTATATRCGRAASRSGCCARTAPASWISRT